MGRNKWGAERRQLLVVKSASQCKSCHLRCMRILEASLAGWHKFFICFLVDLKFCPYISRGNRKGY